MFRLRQKVKILSSKKIDGRYNYGTIIGIELIEGATYLGYFTEREYLSRFTNYKYKVAYIECVNDKATWEWFNESDLELKRKVSDGGK